LPKAVVPTELYGQCADLDRILEICEPYGIPVVVDAAEALGAKRKLKAQSSPEEWPSDFTGQALRDCDDGGRS
jgi:dTDP-4-amino-4,6-dideoxygalactose transaminase